MYLHIINYLAFLLVILSLMLIIDIIITFKKPSNLKIVIILIPTILIIRGIGFLYFFHFEYNRWLIELPFSLNAALALIFVSYLYYNKHHWFYYGFAILFFLFGLSFQFYYSVKQINSNIPLSEISKELRMVKGIFSITTFVLFLNLFYKILVSFKPNNQYLYGFRKWLISLFVIFLINFSIVFINQIFKTRIEIFVLTSNILIVIILYFRPRFFNIINLKISQNISFEKKNLESITNPLFINIFFTQQYFLNDDANVGQFCDQLGVKPDILKEYINKNYQMSFSDLINKNRIEYFVELIKSEKYQHFTIEALSQLAGFGSRVHLYNNFKKFHGGKPSDLIKIINS